MAARADHPPLLLIFAITVSGITANTLVTPSIPDILAGLEVGAQRAGIFVAAGTLPGIVLAPVIGILADRFGRREVIVPCLVLFAVAGGLGGLSPGFWWLIAARFLQGAGSAGLVNLAIVLIGDHWEGETRAHMIGRNAAVLTVCLAVFPILGGGLTDAFGWRAPFALYPLALVTAVAVWRRLPGGVGDASVTVRDQLRRAWPFLRTARVRGALGSTFVAFVLIFGLLLTVLPVHLEQAFGLGASWRGAILGLPALGATLASSNLGRLVRLFPRRRLLQGAAVLWGVALLLVGVAPSLVLLLIGTTLFGLGEGTLVPSLQDIAVGAAPTASRGAIVATLVSSARLGQTVGPVAASFLFGAVGAGWTFAAAAALGVATLVPLGTLATREGPTHD